jgi:hypothetical protein
VTSLNRPARLNLWLLAIIGGTLVTGGGIAMATSLGWLPLTPATPLVPGTELPPTWTLYTVAGVLALLCLRWLAAQFVRKPKTHTWRIEYDPDHGHTGDDVGIAGASERLAGSDTGGTDEVLAGLGAPDRLGVGRGRGYQSEPGHRAQTDQSPAGPACGCAVRCRSHDHTPPVGWVRADATDPGVMW